MNIRATLTMFVATCVVSLTGCVSTRTVGVPNDTAFGMRGKSLVVSQRTKPDFGATTPGKAMFGLIGAVAMISAGRAIVEENDIQDPAPFIAGQLRQQLVERYGLEPASGAGALADTTDTLKLASLYAGADYLLDVQTINWGFLYRPNITRYRVLYSVKVRLIDIHAAKLLAEGFCYRKDDNDPHPPTYDELLTAQASLLKARLQADAAECSVQLSTEMFGPPRM